MREENRMCPCLLSTYVPRQPCDGSDSESLLGWEQRSGWRVDMKGPSRKGKIGTRGNTDVLPPLRSCHADIPLEAQFALSKCAPFQLGTDIIL